MRVRADRRLALVAALLSVCAPAAGAPLYDMTPLLDAPHPFATDPLQLRRPAAPPGYSGRLYDMGPLLDAPHPFEAPAAPPESRPTAANIGTGAGGSGNPPLRSSR